MDQSIFANLEGIFLQCGEMQHLSHRNDICPTKVSGTQDPVFQTRIVSFQDQYYPNALSLQQHNVILSLQEPVTALTRGRYMYTLLKST